MQDFLESKSQADLFDMLGRYRCEPPLQIRVVVVGSQEDLAALAEKRSPFPFRVRENGDLSVGQFDYESGDIRLHGSLFFCPSPRKNIYYLISVCSSVVWRRSILRLVNSLYPKLVPVFFSQQELFELLKLTKGTFAHSQLTIIGHSRKQRLRIGSRRKYETSRTRTEKPLDAVFAEANEQNYWFSSVSVEIARAADDDKRLSYLFTSATLSKYGDFSCASQFDRFLNGTINKMGEIAEKKMKFFSNRSRRSTQSSEARPISITYASPEFTSQTDTNSFVSIMRKMSGASCTVLHDNPYIHLSVVDANDGSAADLWVLKNDEILLVPQLRASEAALKRFVNYIFEEWREGSVTSTTSTDGVQP
jgi:hypothetical protein